MKQGLIKFLPYTLPLLFVTLFLFGCVKNSRNSQEQLLDVIKKGKGDYTLIDVRTEDEFSGGHIPGAVNIPVDIIESSPPDVPKDSLIIVYCRSGARSNTARGILLRLGYTDVKDFGGISNYKGELAQ